MFTIVGFKMFVSKKDQKLYYELHMLSEDRFVEGQRVDSCFVAADQIDNVESLTVGCLADVFFGRYSRSDRLSIDHIIIR